MTLYQKVQAVKRLYERLAIDSRQIQQEAGLHCLLGCGRCCTYPNIEATPLEFLPLAYDLFVQGEAEKWLSLSSREQLTCINFRPSGHDGQGTCGNYAHRGLICRLFGYSLRRDKYGALQLAACKTMKEHTPEQISHVASYLAAGGKAPISTEYYQRLASIDPSMSSDTMPINDAIREAVETVIAYYSYRRRPRRPRKAA